MARHSNKHIQAAIEYALAAGWRFEKAGPRAHIFGRILCSFVGREGCSYNIHGTPRVPEVHAQRIRRAVDQCPHQIGNRP